MTYDIAAFLKEASELPDTSRSLWTHNERELINFCKRLASALEAQRAQLEAAKTLLKEANIALEESRLFIERGWGDEDYASDRLSALQAKIDAALEGKPAP